MYVYIYSLSCTLQLGNEVKHCNDFMWSGPILTPVPRLVGLPRLEGGHFYARLNRNAGFHKWGTQQWMVGNGKSYSNG